MGKFRTIGRLVALKTKIKLDVNPIKEHATQAQTDAYFTADDYARKLLVDSVEHNLLERAEAFLTLQEKTK